MALILGLLPCHDPPLSEAKLLMQYACPGHRRMNCRLFSAIQKIYFYFFPPRSPALPCSILSSLALCVTPTQGLREMNGLIPVGKEWNITWCAHTCTNTHTHTDSEGYMNTMCGTVHILKYTLAHTHTHAMVLTALVKGDRLMEKAACCKASQNDNRQMQLY